MPEFRGESLREIIEVIERALAGGVPTVTFEVVDPDLARGRYAGELVEHEGVTYVHRPFRVWIDLAERLGLRLRTPRMTRAPLVELTFERLDPNARWKPAGAETTERYGSESGFARISKLEDPGFVIDLREAVQRCRLPKEDRRPRILDLGVNTGDELALMMSLLGDASFVGVDHSASALAVARQRFMGANVELVEGDLNMLEPLALGLFDLVVSIGTLQSPGIDDRALLRHVIAHHVRDPGAAIFGFPNCRYVDGETEFGTRMKNFRQPELGLLVKDVALYRKYLQQHRYEVFVTGKNYMLVTGVRRA
ncbi:MAG: hypothetical protein JWO36_2544 [Myxococcales bacterium]|nr:hypothetical protein [Myxococcales bacterium]